MARTRKSALWRKQMITLMSVAPRTVAELCERTGCSDTFARKELIKWKEAGMCYLHAYRHNGNISGYSALFSCGTGEDAKPPKAVEKQRAERNRRTEHKKNEQNSSAEGIQRSTSEKVKCYGIWGLA